MMKKWICIAMSLVLFLGPVLPTAAVAASADSTGAAEAAAEKQETEAEAAAKARSWETDIRISIRDERQLMQESGMTLDAWDEAVARSRPSSVTEKMKVEFLPSDGLENIRLSAGGIVDLQ